MLGGADDLLPPIQQPRFVQSVPETAIRKRDESLVSRLQPSRKGEIAYTRRVGNGHVCEDFVFPVGMPDLQAVLPSNPNGPEQRYRRRPNLHRFRDCDSEPGQRIVKKCDGATRKRFRSGTSYCDENGSEPAKVQADLCL